MTADVTFDAAAVITNIVLNTAGSGYVTADDTSPITIDLTSLISGTFPATQATIDVSCTGSFADQVDSITITNPGSDYIAVTVVTIDAPGAGVTATATVVMTQCTTLTIGDCGGGGPFTIDNLDVTDTISLCGASTPTVPGDYDVAEDLSGNCLCSCENVDLTEGGGINDINVTYIECGTAPATATTEPISAGATITRCIVTDSITFEDVAPGTAGSLIITVNSTCDGA
jgi:hypothetical protein